ncbi:MAG: CHAT domain-containing protein, partial [Microvirga sp.]
MVHDSVILGAMRALHHRGAYGEAARYPDAVPGAIHRPMIALERSRAFMRQGHPVNAEAALACADHALATRGEKLILAVEAASLMIYRRVAIREALRAAQVALSDAEPGTIAPDDRAEAERVQARIILAAATHHEVTAEEAGRTCDRLPALADILARAGRTDEALAARLTHAERLDVSSARLHALSDFADAALASGRPDLAGEACVVRAEHLLAEGAATAEIESALAVAADLYAASHHVHGPIDIRRIRSRLAIERAVADLKPLEACLDAYGGIDFPRGALGVLMDLSRIAHERGDTVGAARYRQLMIELADLVGMGLVKDGFQTAQVDLLMRSNDYGAAIELCEAALAGELPAVSQAGYELLLASAYSFVNDPLAACDHGRRAVETYEAVGAVDAASDAVTKLASDLASLRRDEMWDEADRWLEPWSVKDEERGDAAAAVAKQEMLAQTKILRFLYSPGLKGKPKLLGEAEQHIIAAEKLAARLHGREAARRLGTLSQMRGQVCQGRNDAPGVIQSWRRALATFESAGFAMEAANCHYMLGVLSLNEANQELMPHFADAETSLGTALTYYGEAGLRERAADTRQMFARLYTNAAVRWSPEVGDQLLDAALHHLRDAEADFDAVRREFAAGPSVIDVQRGKHGLVQKSRHVYETALDILCRIRPDPAGAWEWAQRAKARALADLLGTAAVPPARIMTAIERHPECLALVSQERELSARIAKASPEHRRTLRQDLQAHWTRMEADPRLSNYLEVRTGAALEAADLVALASDGGEAEAPVVCVDWVTVGEAVFVLGLRPGHPPRLARVALPLDAVQAFIRDNLAPESFRTTLRDMPELLRRLDPLIAPLADFSRPGDLLVLSPTGPLHSLPLHAIEIDEAPLLVRNPVVYCPSLTVLRHCLSRRTARGAPMTAALLGDPNGDRTEAARLVAYLEDLFRTTSLVGEQVTRSAFAESVAGRDVVHFQGHAVHRPDDPLESSLALADGRLTARDVFGLTNLRARLVTLGACESAASVIAAGDEPLGLIPAFLYSGASAVLATLWKVNQGSAARTMQDFYDLLSDGRPVIDRARALQKAMLAVR